MLAEFTFCEVAQTYVFTDQTKKECLNENQCPEGTKCPLEGCFAEETQKSDLSTAW